MPSLMNCLPSTFLLISLYFTSVSCDIWSVSSPEGDTEATGPFATISSLMDFSVDAKLQKIKIYQYGLDSKETQGGWLAWLKWGKENRREICYDPTEANMKTLLAEWKNKNVVILIHESDENPDSHAINAIVKSFFKQNSTMGGNFKVVVVDWQGIGSTAKDLAKVALVVACFSTYLAKSKFLGIPASNIHLIGNGNATDISAMASLYMRYIGSKQETLVYDTLIGSITGLDPPEKLATKYGEIDYLSSSDAMKVTIVYSSSWSPTTNSFRTCHFDFFVDHGVAGKQEKVIYHDKAALYYAVAREHNMAVHMYDKMNFKIGQPTIAVKFGDNAAPDALLSGSYYLQVLESEGLIRNQEAITTVFTSVISKSVCDEYNLNA